MVLILESDNPNFSYLLRKNPDTSPHISQIRKGIGMGWFSSEQEYTLYFIESSDELSYPDYVKQFQYLHDGHLCSPLAAQNLLKEFFNSSFKDHDLDVPHNHSLQINHLKFDYKLVNYFHDSGIFIECSSLDKNPENERVIISSKFPCTLKNFLQNASLFLLFVSIDNRQVAGQNRSYLERFLEFFEDVSVPYMLRYRIKTNMLRSRELFEEFSQKLTKSIDKHFVFTYGNTQIARKDFASDVFSNLENIESVVDIGCGEGQYVRLFKGKVGSVHAVDIDTEVLERTKKRIGDKGVFYYEALEHVPPIEGAFVLLSEVIEHVDNPEYLLSLANRKFKNSVFCITTPNVNFNVNYLVDYRHPDHKWEGDFTVIQALLKSVFKTVIMFPVGDVVDGEPVSWGAVCANGV